MKSENKIVQKAENIKQNKEKTSEEISIVKVNELDDLKARFQTVPYFIDTWRW